MIALLAAVVLSAEAEPSDAARPNILFIAVDDLRPEIGAFGADGMHTPGIDALCGRGVRFERAYCNVPVCGASRASLMTGVRPSRTRFRAYDCFAERQAPGAIPLHTHLKAHGYATVGGGKLFHQYKDHADGWTQRFYRPKAPLYAKQENIDAATTNPSPKKRGSVTEAADVADAFYKDGQLAEWGVRQIGELAGGSQPFFLAVGFYKPHLPFIAPQRDWDRYGEVDPTNYLRPPSIPDRAFHTSGEIRAYAGVPKTGILPLPLARHLIHGYHACVSYTDRQIGSLIDALDASGEADRTIVVLWGDHGWNLGEHAMWCKHCCFETSMRTPLVIAAPTLDGHAAGQASRSLVEFTDIYPTLCELVGIDAPDGSHPEGRPSQLDGRSLVPLLTDPSQSLRPWAIGRYGYGDTIKTDRYRYSEFTGPGGKVLARMLFDHEADPGELTNLAEEESMRSVVDEMAGTLAKNKGRDAE